MLKRTVARELHSMANASSFSGDSSIFMNNNDKNKNIPIKSKEEKLEQNIDEVKIMIESVGEKLKEVSPLQSRYNIYHVPRRLYKLNPDAYRADTVSIGPLHHNDDRLWITETHKLQYLNHLLNGCEKTFKICIDDLSGLEEKARKCYSDTMNLEKAEFVKMMMMDSCFILQFLDSWRLGTDDHHFVSNESWGSDILNDLIKLENQLPLFVVEHLHGLLFDDGVSFCDYIYDSLIMPVAEDLNGSIHFSAEEKETLIRIDGGAKHFLDLLRRALIASPREKPSNERDLQLACNATELMRANTSAISGGAKHFLDLLRRILFPSPREIPSSERNFLLARNATELKSAGVKFRKNKNASNLFDINFDKGVLTIPTIELSDDTEVVLRNLIALEQENLGTSQFFTSYAAFMDDLVDTTKDVTLLTQKGIIINGLGSPEDVATLFNKIVKHVIVGNRNTNYLSCVIKDLNEYYNISWNKRMANLRQTYFNSPWAGISVAAAMLVIILTMIQTICSLLQI